MKVSYVRRVGDEGGDESVSRDVRVYHQGDVGQRVIERDGKRQVVFPPGEPLEASSLDRLTGEDTPPSGAHEPATAAERRLMAANRELTRQLHEALQELQGLRDQMGREPGEEE